MSDEKKVRREIMLLSGFGYRNEFCGMRLQMENYNVLKFKEICGEADCLTRQTSGGSSEFSLVTPEEE